MVLLEGLKIFRTIEPLSVKESINNGKFFDLDDGVIKILDEIILPITEKLSNGQVNFIFEIVFDKLKITGSKKYLLFDLTQGIIKIFFFFFVAMLVLHFNLKFLSIDKFLLQLLISCKSCKYLHKYG